MAPSWIPLAPLVLVTLLALGLLTPVAPFTLAELGVENLSSQTVLNISYKNPGDTLLSGPIPTDLGRLTNLTTLVLTAHRLSGGIPPELGNLTRLEYLDISNNSLSGTIPAELGQLTSLTHIQLSVNRLSGSLPAELGKLVNVTVFELSYNELSGPVPGALGNLTRLVAWELHDNNLTGPLPPEIGNMANLTILGFHNNRINGSLPPQIGQLAKLESLSLYNNQLSGPLPAELENMTNLIRINIWNNSLSGPIPNGIGRLANLQQAFMENNSFSGALPASIGNLTRLRFLGLTNSALSGAIPASLGYLPSAVYFGLGGNSLTGSIPPELGNLPAMESLDLSNNNLTGPIPQELANITSLSRLLLNGNRLSGSPPPQLASLPSLFTLDLRNNSLSGVISPVLASKFGLENLLPGNPLLSVGTAPNPVPAPPLVPAPQPAVSAPPAAFNITPSPGSAPSPPAAVDSPPPLAVLTPQGPPPSVPTPQPAVNITPSITAPPNSLASPPTETSSSGGSPVVIVAAAGGGAAALLAAALAGLCLYRRRKRDRNPNAVPLAPKAVDQNESGLFDQPPSSTGSGATRRSNMPPSQRYFSLDELRAATDGWSEANVVGSGSFGTVYRGTLPDRTIVAIKRLDQRRRGRASALEERSWNAELAALSKVRHKHLVQFMGACSEDEERLLIFEFVSGGSLGQRLRSAREAGVPFLSWAERMAVVEGVCRGLAYLHHDISPPLLHRDIKASNILLKGGPPTAPLGGGSSDKILRGVKFEACIADFGLAHLLEDADTAGETTSAVKGTLPYMAPEYLQGGSQFLSTKCDVYSFGVLTLELLSGRSVTDRAPGARFEPLAAAAARLVAEGRGLDFINVAASDTFRVREAECALQIALGCIQRDPSARPTMEQISMRLKMIAPEEGGSERSVLSGAESASAFWGRDSTDGSSVGHLSSGAWGSTLPSGSVSIAVPFQFLDAR